MHEDCLQTHGFCACSNSSESQIPSPAPSQCWGDDVLHPELPSPKCCCWLQAKGGFSTAGSGVPDDHLIRYREDTVCPRGSEEGWRTSLVGNFLDGPHSKRSFEFNATSDAEHRCMSLELGSRDKHVNSGWLFQDSFIKKQRIGTNDTLLSHVATWLHINDYNSYNYYYLCYIHMLYCINQA